MTHACRRPWPEDLEEKALRDILEQIRLKIDLENKVKPAIAGAFGKLIGSFRRIWPTFQMLPPRAEHVDRFRSIFLRQYRSVGRAFGGTVASDLRAQLTTAEKEMRDRAVKLWSERRAPLQAGAVVDTSLRQMVADVRRAMMRLSAENKPVTAETTARLAAEMMRVDFGRRVPSIATHETQSSAEMTKLFEAESMAGVLPAPLHGQEPPPPPPAVLRILIKIWQTREDELVRSWHAVANGQTRPIEEPFTVGGQSLMVPGDRSLGATLANVINCRCSPRYEDRNQ